MRGKLSPGFRSWQALPRRSQNDNHPPKVDELGLKAPKEDRQAPAGFATNPGWRATQPAQLATGVAS